MSRPRLLVLTLIGGLTLFHLWYIGSGRLPLSPDEAHYWEWSRRLDWGYYSKGPMVAYLIALSTRLGGSTEFFVRLPAVLLSAGTALLTFLLGRDLYRSERVGSLAVLILTVIPLYAAGSLLMTIDPPFLFFWTVALWAFLRALTGGSVRWWILVGIALGLGTLSKYSMLLLVPLLACVLVLSPTLPDARRGFLLSCGTAALLASPLLLWNLFHGWISLHHVIGQTGLAPEETWTLLRALLNVGEFWGAQALLLSPLLFVVLLAAMGRAGLRAIRQRTTPDLLLALTSLLPFLLFAAWSLLSKVQGNWPAPAYLTASIAAAAWGEASASSRALRIVLGLSLAVALLVTTALHFPTLLGDLLPPRMDPVRRLHGWRELGRDTGRLLRTFSDPVILMSDRYQIASELAFYVPGQPTVYTVNLGRRLNQYDVWGGLNALRGRSTLLVTYGDGDVPAAFRGSCATVTKLSPLRYTYRGVPAQTFSLFHCTDFRGAPPVPGRVRY